MPENADLPQAELSSSNSEILYTGTFEIDIETMTIAQDPKRQSDWVYNITGFLPNKCPGGCFRFRILNIVGTVLEIELTIENPLALQVYDTRIVYLHLFGKTVLNPDSYTDFPGTSLAHVFPFTAFAKGIPDRAFPVGPGGIDTEILLLDFPPGALASVNYAITCSMPGNTLEPYEISDMGQLGTLTPMGGSATISCKVDDHQDNIGGVHLDATPLTGGVEIMQPDVGNPGYYEIEISNTQGASVGAYNLLIAGYSSNPQNIFTYNFVEASVTPDVSGGVVVYGNSGNIYSCDPDHSDINFITSGYMPCISQSNNVIVYCSGYSGDLRAVNVDGTNDRLVKAGSYQYPTVTADGAAVAFYDNVTPKKCYRINTDGTGFAQISADDGVNWDNANISGNGSTIVMLRYESPYTLYLCDGDGGNLRELIQTGTSSYATITCDAQWIFYEVAFQIRRIRADGTHDQLVIGQSATSRFGITPDGTKVTFCQYYSGNGNDLGFYDLTTGIETRLTFTNRNAGEKTITLDGQWIIADSFAVGGLYSIRTDGSGSIIEWGVGDDPSCHGAIGEHY